MARLDIGCAHLNFHECTLALGATNGIFETISRSLRATAKWLPTREILKIHVSTIFVWRMAVVWRER